MHSTAAQHHDERWELFFRGDSRAAMDNVVVIPNPAAMLPPGPPPGPPPPGPPPGPPPPPPPPYAGQPPPPFAPQPQFGAPQQQFFAPQQQFGMPQQQFAPQQQYFVPAGDKGGLQQTTIIVGGGAAPMSGSANVTAAAQHVGNLSIAAAVVHFVALVLCLICIFVPWVVQSFPALTVSYGLTSITQCISGLPCTTVNYNNVLGARGFENIAVNPNAAFLTIMNTGVAFFSLAAILFMFSFISSIVGAVAQLKAVRNPSETPSTCGCMGTAFSGTGLAGSAYVFGFLASVFGLTLFTLFFIATGAFMCAAVCK